MKKILCTLVGLMISTAAIAEDKTGPYIFGLGGLSGPFKQEYDNQSIFGAGAGYDFGNWRVQLEADRLSTGGPTTSLDWRATAYTGGVYYDFANSTTITPYVGIFGGQVNFDGAPSGVDDNSWIIGGVGGAAFKLTEAVSFTGEYRYMTSGAELKTGSGKLDNYEAHMLVGGVRYTF